MTQQAGCLNGSRRAAFSLLEVLLATGILLGSLIVLSELAGIGGRRVRSAEALATAQRICQTKMHEILAGLADPEPVEDEPVADEPGWVCSIQTESVPQPGLIGVRVTVGQDLPEQMRPTRFTLVRWVRQAPSTGDDGLPSRSLLLPSRFEGGP
jgi:type II secretory pathway pseudopilin PulG